MKSLKHGKNISISIENITPFGIWVFVKGKEYFLNYQEYPYFKNQTLSSIQNVKLLHGYHLYWPDLDVDLEIDKKKAKQPTLNPEPCERLPIFLTACIFFIHFSPIFSCLRKIFPLYS